MKAVGERSIAFFIGIVLETAWWLGVVGLVFLAGLLVFSFGINMEGRNLTMNLPVAVDLTTPIHGGSPSPQADARIGKLRGNIQFPVRNGEFFSASMFLIVVLFGCLLWGLNQLRQVFRSLSRGLVFVPENPRRVRRVGLIVIFWELARAAVVYFWSYYTSLHFTANGLRFVASADFNGVTIIAGLCMLVIAEVFREGTRLREEQSLTI